MKKLLTVFCVAACGIGAAAQAQTVRPVQQEMIPAHQLMQSSSELNTSFGAGSQFKQTGSADYDTLRWQPEYNTRTPDCNGYYSLVAFGVQELFADDVVLSPFGASFSGTAGEVGATFIVEDNSYMNYASIDVKDARVVGAWGVAYRLGATGGWDRVMERYMQTEHYNADHMSGEMNIPELPYKLKGYRRVQRQEAIKSYFELFTQNNAATIEITMPVSKEEAVETPVRYLPFYPATELSDGRAWPQISEVSGMFSESFPAYNNFGISMEAQLTGNQTFDSLWNWSLCAKHSSKCSFINGGWDSWNRVNMSSDTNCWRFMVEPIKVGQSLWAENDEDFGLNPGTDQTDPENLYIYAFSLNMMLADGDHYMPMLYPIIQHGFDPTKNESDAYAQTISLYPLPAKDKVTMVALDPIQKVEIYNMAGALVKAIVVNGNLLELDVTSYTPGTYVAKIMTEKGTASKKMLVR